MVRTIYPPLYPPLNPPQYTHAAMSFTTIHLSMEDEEEQHCCIQWLHTDPGLTNIHYLQRFLVLYLGRWGSGENFTYQRALKRALRILDRKLNTRHGRDPEVPTLHALTSPPPLPSSTKRSDSHHTSGETLTVYGNHPSFPVHSALLEHQLSQHMIPCILYTGGCMHYSAKNSSACASRFWVTLQRGSVGSSRFWGPPRMRPPWCWETESPLRQ